MLKGLAVRQGLLAMNAALGVVFVLILAQMVRQGFLPDINPVGVAINGNGAGGESLKLAQVRELKHYSAVATGGLFGTAGSFTPGQQASVPPPPAEDATEETTLPLKLFGTALSEGPSPRAAAIIDVRDGSVSGTRTFYLGDEVMENVVLEEVRAQSVVLDNRRDNRRELLQIDWTFSGAPGQTSLISRQLGASAAVSRPNLITLNRTEIQKKLEDQYAQVASTLDVQVVTGDDGTVQGITTDNVEQYDVARELGFQNGDVLVSINNEPVKSREDAVNVVKRYQDASIFRIGLLRGGHMQYITYRVR